MENIPFTVDGGDWKYYLQGGRWGMRSIVYTVGGGRWEVEVLSTPRCID